MLPSSPKNLTTSLSISLQSLSNYHLNLLSFDDIPLFPRKRQQNYQHSSLIKMESRSRTTLLSLPAEIRLHIFNYYLHSCGLYYSEGLQEQMAMDDLYAHDILDTFEQAKNLFLVCRQTYAESRSLFCRMIRSGHWIFFSEFEDLNTFQLALRPILRAKRLHIRGSLTLHNAPWRQPVFPIEELMDIIARDTGFLDCLDMESNASEVWDEKPGEFVNSIEMAHNGIYDTWMEFKIRPSNIIPWDYIFLEFTDLVEFRCFNQILALETRE
ncbi:hypothetical protein BT63DRAFT_472776 [Microthyrium microscopicum]|uniref:Uncharacterized protein n=1 Tax=Microthyrium microscopicum TaxID=703497 RepID=A0A6A6U9S9_9PEZI|nr:hypothetical protein BT63DRAFT_472776 [Microthyrium microscopicum]